MAQDAAQPERQEPLRPGNRRTYELGAGPSFDRVAYFSDAVFAIAMTLLIVAVEAPDLQGPNDDDPSSMLRPLVDLAPQLFSFFLAFGCWGAIGWPPTRSSRPCDGSTPA